jgi:hypothetical protein
VPTSACLWGFCIWLWAITKELNFVMLYPFCLVQCLRILYGDLLVSDIVLVELRYNAPASMQIPRYRGDRQNIDYSAVQR